MEGLIGRSFSVRTGLGPLLALFLLVAAPAARSGEGNVDAGPEPDELGSLVDSLLTKLRTFDAKGEATRQRLPAELERLRHDIERMAELLDRDRLRDIRKDTRLAIAETQAEDLNKNLARSEDRLDRAGRDRDRLQGTVAESTQRLVALSHRMTALDSDRDRLADEATAARDEAERLQNEMRAAVARTAEAAARYRAEADAVRKALLGLKADVAAERARLVAKLEAQAARIDELEDRPAALPEVMQAVLTDAEKDPPQAAPPGSSGPPREQAAPEDGTEGCPALGLSVDQPYLRDEWGKGWRPYLVGIVHFAPGLEDIEHKGLTLTQDCLQRIAGRTAWRFKIVGHTDARGEVDLNRGLSLERANAVRAILLRSVAIEPERVLTEGLGEAYPVADNATRTGRGLNRRVEVFAVATSQ